MSNSIQKNQSDRKILVVEDNPLNARLMGALLDTIGCTHSLAMSAAAAVKQLATAFDVILMDVELPDMNGLEIVDRLRQGEYGPANRNTQVFIVSAHNEDELEQECLGREKCRVLLKPVSLDNLRKALTITN